MEVIQQIPDQGLKAGCLFILRVANIHLAPATD